MNTYKDVCVYKHNPVVLYSITVFVLGFVLVKTLTPSLLSVSS